MMKIIHAHLKITQFLFNEFTPQMFLLLESFETPTFVRFNSFEIIIQDTCITAYITLQANE